MSNSVAVKDIVLLSISEIEQKILDFRRELFDLKMEHSIKKLANPAKIKSLRRDIAKLLTILNEKKAS